MTVIGNEETIQIEEEDSIGGSISVGSYEVGKLHIEIDNPWSGSTATGFGCTSYISLSKEQAKLLGEFLLKWSAT